MHLDFNSLLLRTNLKETLLQSIDKTLFIWLLLSSWMKGVSTLILSTEMEEVEATLTTKAI
jgi:hypothetical protein